MVDSIAHQAPLSIGFRRQEYLSGLPFPSPGDLPDPGIEPTSPALAGGFFTIQLPGEAHVVVYQLSKPPSCLLSSYNTYYLLMFHTVFLSIMLIICLLSLIP